MGRALLLHAFHEFRRRGFYAAALFGGAALYLASRAGAYVTGAVLPVDGGITTL